MGMPQRDLDLLVKYENDLLTTLNLPYLIPNLRKHKLLANSEVEQLTKKDITPREANNTFLSILKTKGRDALPLFITTLREEREHLGHQTLFEELHQDYCGFPSHSFHDVSSHLSGSTQLDEAIKLQSANQESDARDKRPTARHQNSFAATDSGIAGLSQKSGASSDYSSNITTSSNYSTQLTSVEQNLKSLMNEVTEFRKDFKEVRVLLSDVSTTTAFKPPKPVHSNDSKNYSGSSKGQRISQFVKQQGNARPLTAVPFKKSSQFHLKTSVIPKDDSAIRRQSRCTSLPIPESLPSVNPIVDYLETLTTINIPSAQPCLPPVVKEDHMHLLSCTTDHKVTKETFHTCTFAGEQWKNVNISGSSNLHQVTFLLTVKDDLAVLRFGSTNSQSQFAKVGIYKLKEMSSWELVPFTNEVLKPFDLNNFECVCSTRHIILASIYQSCIVFYIHNYSSQWISTSFSLPVTCSSYKLQSCTIIHSLELYCSLLCTGRNGIQTVEIHKVKLDKTDDKRESINVVYQYNASILQCHLFTTGGRVMIMKVIADSNASILELCALNDASDHFLQRKKEYPFIIELSSVLPIHCPTYKNHVLIVYYDSRFSKWIMEIFSLE